MKRISVIFAAFVFLAACTTNPFTGERQASRTGLGAGLGALAGAGVGALVSDDPRKGALIGAGIGLLAGGGIGLYMDNQEAALRHRLQASGVSVTRVGNDIILNMPSNITFDSGKSDIKAQFFEVLNSVAIVLNEYNQSLIDIYGHTDSDGSDESNLVLSNERAGAVSQYLIAQQVNPQRMLTRGFGESQPVAPNSTAAGKQQNRRVEIRIVPLS